MQWPWSGSTPVRSMPPMSNARLRSGFVGMVSGCAKGCEAMYAIDLECSHSAPVAVGSVRLTNREVVASEVVRTLPRP